MTENDADTPALARQHEQEILDTALLESDQLLARSLHDDERRRRRRWLVWSSILVVGGVSMSVLLFALMFTGPTDDLGQVAQASDKRPTRDEIERAEALSAEGWTLWQQRKMTAAAKKFAASVELNPGDANAWNGYGWALFNSGQSTKALGAFEKCVKISPKHPAGLNGLGQLYLSRGEYKKAEKYLIRSAKYPQASAAWWGLTKVYLLTGKFDKALPWAKKVAAASPDDKYAQQMLAAAQAGKLDDELRRLIEPVIDDKQDDKGEAGDSPDGEKSKTEDDAKSADLSELLQDLHRTVVCYTPSSVQTSKTGHAPCDKGRLEIFHTAEGVHTVGRLSVIASELAA